MLSGFDVSLDSNAEDLKETNDQPLGERSGEVKHLIKITIEALQSLSPAKLDAKILEKLSDQLHRLAEISNICQAKEENFSALKLCIANDEKAIPNKFLIFLK